MPSPSKLEPLSNDDLVDDLEFTPGQRYDRQAIHDIYGGQPYRGIATPKDYPAVFLFTGDSGETYGYEDEFLDDGTFLYTGEGTEGDMTMNEGNAAINSHKRTGTSLHLFENTDEAWVVTYVGEFECTGVREARLKDKNDEYRDAFRFELEPVGGEEVELHDTGGDDLQSLYERAKASSPRSGSGGSSGGSSTSTRNRYSRSQAVRDYALAHADGVCQGCEEDAPFITNSGDPYLEVHHLYRRADGGADEPENVIALCANCHRRVHEGEDGDAFNEELIKKQSSSVTR